jgi:hypothetical protein
MRIRPVAFVATALFFAPLISISTAAADSKTPAPTIQKSIDPKEVYKNALEDFRKELKVYEDSRREINMIFKEAIDRALADAKSTKSVGQTQIQKRQSMNIRERAVIAATVSRDAAIEALGSPPIAPTPPAKIPNVAKNKSQQTEKPPTLKK